MTNFDLKTLGLADGTHSITVVARASGYKDSPPSNAVNYVVSEVADTVTIPAGTYTFIQNPNLSVNVNADYSFYFITTNVPDTHFREYSDISVYDNQIVYLSAVDPDEDFTAYINGSWQLYGGYDVKTITLKTPQTVSAEFYQWFISNSTKQEDTVYKISAGTYKFKDTISYEDEFSESFNFTSNGSSFTSILVDLSPSLGICVGYGNSRVYASGSNGWSYNNSNYQTITTTTEQTVSKDFYDWFVENTYTLAGVYVFNKTISGMTGATGYPNYQFTVNYTTEYYDGDTFIQGNGTDITLFQGGVFFFTSDLESLDEMQNRYSDGTNTSHIGWYSFSAEHGTVFQPETDTDRIRTYDFGAIPQPVPENFYNWVHANAKQLITFTIDGTTYQAENGMTWGEWVNSSYNTGGYIVSNDTIKLNGETTSDSVLLGGGIIRSSDTIIANTKYYYGMHSGGSGN